MNQEQHERAQHYLQQAEQALVRCQEDFLAGQPVAVEAVEYAVRDLCSLLTKMPVEEAGIYQEPLQALGQVLDALEVAMQERVESYKQELGGLNQQQRAHTAYSKHQQFNHPDKD